MLGEKLIGAWIKHRFFIAAAKAIAPITGIEKHSIDRCRAGRIGINLAPDIMPLRLHSRDQLINALPARVVKVVNNGGSIEGCSIGEYLLCAIDLVRFSARSMTKMDTYLTSVTRA